MIGIMLMAVDFESNKNKVKKDKAILKNDKEKVTYIYQKYYKLIFYIISHKVKKEDDIQDLVQESMLRIIKNIRYIDLDDKVKAKYLFSTIARNVCIDYFSKAKKESDNPEEYDPDETIDSAENTVMDSYAYEEIREALDHLDDKYRDVCILKYVYEYKEREIAEMLGITPGLVNQRIFRGKREIKKLIKNIMERRGL